MVSKSTNEKLKLGIAVRFHGEEGMVSNKTAFLLTCFGCQLMDQHYSRPAQFVLNFSVCFRARVWFGSGLTSCPMRSSTQTMLCSLNQLMVRDVFLTVITFKHSV